MLQPELIQHLKCGHIISIETIPTLPVDSKSWQCRRLEQPSGDSGTEEALSPFTFAPHGIHLSQEHEIFEDGDIHRHLYLQDLSSSTADADNSPKLSVSAFGCHISGCNQVFSSVEEYEHHYNSLHRHVCCSCQRSLPSARLLDIHIQEWHDPLFTILTQKQDMFQCLVEGCELKFKTGIQRKDHLIRIHKYPPDFRFDKAKKNRRTKHMKIQQPTDRTMEVSDGVCVVESACEGACNMASIHPEEGESMEVPLPPEEAICLVTGATSGPSEMNTEHPAGPPTVPHATDQQKPRYSYRVPSSVCFGKGSVRGFRGQGRKK
ncbi:zinc finger protein 511 isoform X1 [Hypomesus transpacificus]|uniref:zinc finger protein 511 isoform X1 n=1 Tax=Hypomesus transpacificus TaxID=137520 RepID=UPI001F074864|nr:zinc finger protein 511 isoform X1 [Hypomesus transpacificus]